MTQAARRAPLAATGRSTAPAAAGATDRLEWLDRARGAGIILVVFGHAWLGIAAAGILHDPERVATVKALIYAFHMPMFFLLSGMTFQAWALRRGPRTALLDRVIRLLWPLVLWHYVFAGFRLLAGDGANVHAGLNSLFTLPLPPVDHFWFLWALFLIQVAAYGLVRGTVALSPRARRGLWLALALAVTLGVAQPGLPLGVMTVNAVLHLPIFLIGMVLTARPLPSGPWIMAGAVVGFVLLDGLALALPASGALAVIGQITLAIGLSLAVCIMMQGLPSGRLTRVLVMLGQLSMPIYLAHTLFTAATRIGLSRLTDAALPHLLAGVGLGLLGPVLLYHLTRRILPPRYLGF